ncbi:MAG: hypothetical protein ACK6EB_20010 [Planctomyces sp.]|jgi:hypothetical protein
MHFGNKTRQSGELPQMLKLASAWLHPSNLQGPTKFKHSDLDSHQHAGSLSS